jgi:hypothetical protein
VSEDAGHAERAIATAQELTGALREFSERVVAPLQKQLRRTRFLLVIGLISLALDFGLTAWLATVAVAAHDATSAAHDAQVKASAVRSSDVTDCEQTNQTRAAEIGLWVYIYDLSDVSRAPKAIQRKDNELIAHVRKVYAPRNCQAIYRLGK